MPSRRLVHDSDSSSSSDSESSLTFERPAKKKSVARKKGKGKRVADQSSDSEKSNPDPPAKLKAAKADSHKADEDYRAAARAVTRCVDMFCKASKVIETILHLADEEAAKHGDLDEDELEREARQRCLQELTPETLDRYKRAYQMLIRLAPRLKILVNDTSKHEELRRVMSLMNKTISMTRADDTARLKDKIGHYAAPNPAVAALAPPVYTGNGSRSNMGVNHPVLARFLCPINSLSSYDEDPESGRQKLMNGKIKMSSRVYPAFFWVGTPPAQNYDPENMFDGLFHGYLLERVIRHIFTGPSTSLGEDSRGTRQCNAELHNMTKVEAAHIAYACVLARFGISARNRWSQKDGLFSYRTFYYTILQQIDKCEDEAWKTALFKHFNMYTFVSFSMSHLKTLYRVLFKDTSGRLAGADRSEDGSGDEGNSDGDDAFLTTMRAQAVARVAAAKEPSNSTVRGQQSTTGFGHITPPPTSPWQPRANSPLVEASESTLAAVATSSSTGTRAMTTTSASPLRSAISISTPTPSPRRHIPSNAIPTSGPALSELSDIESPSRPVAGSSEQNRATALAPAKRRLAVVSDADEETPVPNKVLRRSQQKRKGKEKAVALSVDDHQDPVDEGPKEKEKQGRTSRRRKSKK